MSDNATEGHKIVPLEPTAEMWFRGRKAFLTSAGDLCRAHSADRASTHADIAPTEIYRAMLAASRGAACAGRAPLACSHPFRDQSRMEFLRTARD